MKKLVISFICLIGVLFMLLFLQTNNQTVSAEGIFPINTAYTITATGVEGQDGFVASYYRSKKTKIVTFDLLKTLENGSFGFIMTDDTDNVEQYQLLTEYATFTANGTLIGSNGAQSSSNVVWEKGNNYKFELNGSLVEIYSKAIFYQEEYSLVSKITFDNAKHDVFGLCAISSGINSANCIIDNLTYLDEEGETVLYNGFNYSNIGDKGTLRVYSDLGGYAEKFDKQTFNVAFVDEFGNLISTQEVCEYNYATLPNAPNKKGYTFVGWNGNYSEIHGDTILYPTYKEGKQKKGCKSVIGFENLCLCFALGVFCLRRKLK